MSDLVVSDLVVSDLVVSDLVVRDLVWNVYRHRSIKLDMIESDGNVDVGKTSAKIFYFDTNILSVYFSFKM